MKNLRSIGRTTFSRLLLLTGLGLTFMLASCSKDEDTPPPTDQKTYVLVHGAFQAAYSWNQVKAALEQKGNRVVAVELPGHGEDHTAHSTISLDSYAAKVIAAINAEKGKVILVGHSMGGMVISAVAEAIPARIERLIYVGAFLPKNGQSLFDLTKDDKESSLSPLLVPTVDNFSLEISDQSQIPAVFCADATDAIKKELSAHYRPDPARPFTDPVILTSSKFGSVAKSYIRTTNDRALVLKVQNQMIADSFVSDVYDIASSHSPHLSKPGELTDLLIAIAK